MSYIGSQIGWSLEKKIAGCVNDNIGCRILTILYFLAASIANMTYQLVELGSINLI